MAVVGIILATIIGFTMGIARLSHNWLVNDAGLGLRRGRPQHPAAAAAAAGLRHHHPRRCRSRARAASLFGLVLLNTGGLFLPRPVPQPGFGVFAIVSLLALLAIPFVLRWAARKRELTGQPVQTLAGRRWACWR